MWDPSAVSTPRKALVALVAAPLALILVLVSAYAVDAAVLTSDSVARNVEVAGVSVGGLSRKQLGAAVDEMAAEFPATKVSIDAGDLHLESTAGDLGMSIDTDGTVARAWAVGRDDPLPTRFLITSRAIDLPGEKQTADQL